MRLGSVDHGEADRRSSDRRFRRIAHASASALAGFLDVALGSRLLLETSLAQALGFGFVAALGFGAF